MSNSETLLDSILQLLKARRCAFVDRFGPHFICSAGAHLFNLVNIEKSIFREHGLGETDMRLHIMFVAPPGFSKSFFLRQFLGGDYSILGATNIHCAFEGAMTEAGWIGTKRFGDDGTDEMLGAAYEHRTGIIGIEEFSSLTQMMKVAHSSQLDTAMLTTLDSGWAMKRLAPGKIEYRTHVSLWAGTQPLRFDLSSGLGRRFYFIYFVPNRKDRAILVKKRREGKNVDPQLTSLTQIRVMINKLMEDIADIDIISFDRPLFTLFDELHVPHFEESLYERLALGYNVMTKKIVPDFKITLDDRLRRLIGQEYNWRNMLKYGAHIAQIIKLLTEDAEEIVESEFKLQLVNLGIDFSQSTKMLEAMKRMRMISVDEVTGIISLEQLPAFKRSYQGGE